MMALLMALLVFLVQRTIARYIMGSRSTAVWTSSVVTWDMSKHRPWKIALTLALPQMGVLILAIPEVYAI